MKNQNRPETHTLGSLDLQQSFHLVKRKTIFRTITHPPSFVHTSQGSRYCLNLKTNKAKLLACNLVVEKS
jgi:hypothetical protein